MSFLDVNDAVVADTLSFIDEFESEQNSAATSTVTAAVNADLPSTASSPLPTDKADNVPSAPVKKVSVNRSRNRLKEELKYLRVKVVELQAQLAELNSGRLASATPRTDDGEEAGNESDENRLANEWQSIAKRQHEARLRAQVENVKLKEMLQAQIKTMTMLERVLRKRTPPVETTPSAYGDGFKRLCPDESARRHVPIEFDELIASLDAVYASVDQVFDANGLATKTEPFQNSQARDSDDGEGMFVEFTECKVVPFDYRTTTSAIWRYIQHECAQSRSALHQGVEETDDTIAMHIGIELAAMRMSARFHGKYAVRRYTEEDRVVYVWRMVITPEQFSAGPTRGLLLRDSGWMAVKKSLSIESATNGPSTVIQACVHIHPVLEDDHDADAPSTVGVLSEFVIRTIEGTVKVANQLLENFLLEETLRWKTQSGPSSEIKR